MPEAFACPRCDDGRLMKLELNKPAEYSCGHLDLSADLTVQVFGTVVETFTDEHGRTWSGVRLVHVGPNGHDRLTSGDTCECGWIKL